MVGNSGSLKHQILLRDLCWITVIAGILLSWWVDHCRQARQQQAAREELSRMRATLMMLRFDPQFSSSERSHYDGE